MGPWRVAPGRASLAWGTAGVGPGAPWRGAGPQIALIVNRTLGRRMRSAFELMARVHEHFDSPARPLLSTAVA